MKIATLLLRIRHENWKILNETRSFQILNIKSLASNEKRNLILFCSFLLHFISILLRIKKLLEDRTT